MVPPRAKQRGSRDAVPEGGPSFRLDLSIRLSLAARELAPFPIRPNTSLPHPSSTLAFRAVSMVADSPHGLLRCTLVVAGGVSPLALSVARCGHQKRRC